MLSVPHPKADRRVEASTASGQATPAAGLQARGWMPQCIRCREEAPTEAKLLESPVEAFLKRGCTSHALIAPEPFRTKP